MNLRLGISASKSALDATPAGYYVSALGHIRQMAEYWFGLQYLERNPASPAGLFAAPEGEAQAGLPFIGARIKEVLAAYTVGGSHRAADKAWFTQPVSKSYKGMSEGHRLDGLAIAQTGDLADPSDYLGSTYHGSLANEALYHGTLMTGVLGFAAALLVAGRLPESDGLVAAISSVFGKLLPGSRPKTNGRTCVGVGVG